MTNDVPQVKKGEGFTFIELLISFSIIFLLAAIAFPVYHSVRDNIILDAESQQIINTLRLAQRSSVISQDGTVHGIHFNANSYVLFGDSWATPTYTNTYQLPSGIQITQGLGSDIIFNRLIGDSSNQQIKVTSPSGKERIIVVTALGEISSL